MHLGKDPVSFKFRKDLAEEWQRINTKYKVRITANLISFISQTILNSCYMQDAVSRERNIIVKLEGEEADDKLTVNYNPRLVVYVTRDLY